MAKHLIGVASHGRYFQFGDGRPFMPIGHNTYGETLWQYWIEGCYRPDHEIEEMFQKLTSHGGNFLRLAIPVSLEESYFKEGNYRAEDVRRLDLLLSLAEKYNVYFTVGLFWPHSVSNWGRKEWPQWPHNPYSFRNGGPIKIEGYADEDTSLKANLVRMKAMYSINHRENISAQKAKIKWFVEHWGGNPHIFCWELSNDLPVNFLEKECKEWVYQMADYIRSIDKFGHLVSFQIGSGITWEKWMVDAVDFTCVRAYPWSVTCEEDLLPSGVCRDNPLSIARHLNRKTREQIRWKKPVITGEFGACGRKSNAIYTYERTSEMELCTLYGFWAPLASGGMPGHRWTGWDGFYMMTPKEYEWMKAVSNFCQRINWANYDSTNVDNEIETDSGECLTMGCRDLSRMIVWIVNKKWGGEVESIQPVVRIKEGLRKGVYMVEWIKPQTNQTLKREFKEGPEFKIVSPVEFKTSLTLYLQRI